MGESQRGGCLDARAQTTDFVQFDETAFVQGTTTLTSWRIQPDGQVTSIRRSGDGVLLGRGSGEEPGLYEEALAAAPGPASQPDGTLGRSAYELIRARVTGGTVEVVTRTETTASMDDVILRLGVLAPATDAPEPGAYYWSRPVAVPTDAMMNLDAADGCDPDEAAMAALVSGGALLVKASAQTEPDIALPVSVKARGIWLVVGRSSAP